MERDWGYTMERGAVITLSILLVVLFISILYRNFWGVVGIIACIGALFLTFVVVGIAYEKLKMLLRGKK